MGTRSSPASPRSLLLAAAIPILFIHVRYQPGVTVGLGSTTIDAYLSDFAVLAVVIAALAAGVRLGFGPLAPGRLLWLAAGLFVVWIVVEVAYGHAHAAAYPWRTHAVTAAKFAEYGLLAPALPLLVRTKRDALLPAWSLAGWSACATAVAVAQFFGARIFFVGTAGHRQASFVGFSDLAALSGAALLLGVVALAAPRLRLGRALAGVALAGGVLGTIVAGAIASVLGVATALVALGIVLLARRELVPRRAAAVAGVAAVVVAGAVAIRATDLGAFARFVGASSSTPKQTNVQTYAHRTLLAWLGYEIWMHHPVLGVGWEGSADPVNFEPYLPAAHRRFPNEAPQAFPAADPHRHYGVQNSWIEALADLGVAGLALWAGVFAAAAWLATRAAVRAGSGTALYALLLTALLVWLWTAQGFVAGIPLDALTWLGLGLAATRPASE